MVVLEMMILTVMMMMMMMMMICHIQPVSILVLIMNIACIVLLTIINNHMHDDHAVYMLLQKL